MTAEKLYGIVKFLETLDSQLGLQKALEQVSNTLANVASAPAQPQHQSALADALSAFESAASKMREALSPSLMAAVNGMGGHEFFDPSIFDKVKNAVQTNAMTPAVARDVVQDLATRRAEFLSTLRSARQSLERLKVTESELKEGSADAAFLIPREMFDNQLGRFAKELKFINQVIEHYSEGITGTPEAAQVEQLSSSVPTVVLLASIQVLEAIATVVNKFLEAWEKIRKIRKMRDDLEDMGLKGQALDELTQHITTTVEEVVEESVQLVVSRYPGDGHRRRELETAVRIDTHRLFGQIERGLTVEFRAKKDPKTNGDKQRALENISNLATQLRFPEVSKAPLLLTSEEVVDDEVISFMHSKKTTSRKTTVTKKGAKQEDGVE